MARYPATNISTSIQFDHPPSYDQVVQQSVRVTPSTPSPEVAQTTETPSQPVPRPS